MNLLSDCESALQQYDVRGQTVLSAVSGGADSVALLCALNRVKSDCGFKLHAVHINHGLRGEESQADAEFVRDLCAALNVKVTIRAGRLATNSAVEESARHIRYAEFVDVANSLGAEFVAVAHTADDQVETILHHIIRGTGPAGLAGIPGQRQLAENCLLIRPLLNVQRAAVTDWLQEVGQAFRTDSSNHETRFTRNRIRHQLLPLLADEFNPQVRTAILKMSAQVSELQAAADYFVDQVLEQALLDSQDNVCRLQRTAFAKIPEQIVRQCFVKVWQSHNWPRKRMTFSHWNALAKIAHGHQKAASLPDGIYATVRNQLIVVSREIPGE